MNDALSDLEYGFTCEDCAENVGETDDGKVICHCDGQQKEKTDTCDYWWK